MKTKVLEKLEETYELVYVDYTDHIPYRTIAECLERKELYPLWEDDIYMESKTNASYDELDELGEKLFKKWEWLKFKEDHGDDYEELRQTILERDQSDPETKVWKQTDTKGRITMFSNYDSWIPPYDAGALFAESDYLTALMAALCLNPKKVKEQVMKVWGIKCSGKWANHKHREGKEVVSYEGFVDVLRNSCNYGLWAFFGMMNMSYLYDNNMNVDDIVIPKGTVCTMFNHWNGGGSCDETTTLRDVSLKELTWRGKRSDKRSFFDLEVDEKDCSRGYSSYEVYGGSMSNELLF